MAQHKQVGSYKLFASMLYIINLAFIISHQSCPPVVKEDKFLIRIINQNSFYDNTRSDVFSTVTSIDFCFTSKFTMQEKLICVGNIKSHLFKYLWYWQTIYIYIYICLQFSTCGNKLSLCQFPITSITPIVEINQMKIHVFRF